MKKAIILEVICYAFILLFTYAALSKLFMFRLNLFDLGRSPLIGDFAPFLSVFLPVSELAISAMLFFPKTRKWGLYGATGLMFAFTAYVLVLFRTQESLPCTCGGLIRELDWHGHLALNIGYTIAGAVGIWLHRTQDRIENGPHKLSFN